MKRLLLAILCLALCLPSAVLAEDFLVTDAGDGTAATAQNTAASKGSAALQLAIGALNKGSLLDAFNEFAKIGKLENADKYASYTQALLLIRREDPAAAIQLLQNIPGFLDSDYQLAFAKELLLHRFADNQKFGYVDATGSWKIVPQFDWAERTFRAESALAHSRDMVSYTPEALYMVALVFTGTTEVGETDIQPDEGKYGLLRNDGLLVVPAKYAAVLWTVNGVAAVTDGTQSFLFDLITGQQIGGAYEDIGIYQNGYITVRQKGLWGYLNPLTGNYVGAGCVWETALPFTEGMAGVSLDDKYGYMNESGTAVIDLQYAGAAPFSEGMAGVRIQKRWGFINSKGTLVIKQTYADVKTFQSGLCAVKKGSAWGMINTQGTMILTAKYSEIGDFDPIYHRAWIRQNKLWGLISSSGGVVLKPAWGGHDEFNANTLCRVLYNKKYSFIDANGKSRIKGSYSSASPFRADYAAVLYSNGKVWYLSKAQRSFTVDSNVPVECKCGFIEGRMITETETQQTDDTGWSYTLKERHIAYTLYDDEGNPITVNAYPASSLSSEPSPSPSAGETETVTASLTPTATAAPTMATAPTTAAVTMTTAVTATPTATPATTAAPTTTPSPIPVDG